LLRFTDTVLINKKLNRVFNTKNARQNGRVAAGTLIHGNWDCDCKDLRQNIDTRERERFIKGKDVKVSLA
jgi:hypothetical protein